MGSAPQRLLRRFRDDTGANLVEATLVLPILLMITFAVLEFGTMLYVQMALQNGVNQGARFAVTRASLPGLTRDASIRKVVIDETPSLTLADGNITFSNMPLGGSTWSGGSGLPNSVERVHVTYTYSIMSIAMQPFFGGATEIVFTADATMKSEGDPQP